MIAVTLPAETLGDVQTALNLAHARNLVMLRDRRHRIPALYASGVRWKREPVPPAPLVRVEGFDDPVTCLRRGWGDCDDLAPWRSAELVIASGTGDDWRYIPVAIPTRAGAHVVVYDRAEQRVCDDPSVRLGMLER